MITSSITKNSRFFLPRRIGLGIPRISRWVLCARKIGRRWKEPPLHVAQETAKQVCQLFESHRARTRPIEDCRAQHAGVCTFPSELQTRHRKVHGLVLL